MPYTKGPDGQWIHASPKKPGSGSKAGTKRKASNIEDRETTPGGRHVSFGRRLVRGPSPAYSRNRTPSRPPPAGPFKFLAEDLDCPDYDELPYNTSGSESPSQQLWSEELSSQGGQHGNTADDSWRPTPFTEEYRQLNPLPKKRLQLKDVIDEAQRDNEVCRRIHDLRARIVDFAQGFVGDSKRIIREKQCLDDLCRDVKNAHLLRYIGCLAQAGPNYQESWRQTLIDPECRVALVVGIIGTALKEHVFSDLWFGGTDEQKQELQKLQEKQKHGDGYERTKQRARACNRYKGKDCLFAAHKVALALRTLLNPLFCLGQKSARGMPEDLSNVLAEIVTIAGNLSREMRQCSDVIYHWPPTFKDEEFEPERMECINIADMISNSPYEKQTVNGRDRSVLEGPAEKAEAIVKIVAFPGLVVHRQGGGALAKRLLAEEEHDYEDSRVPPDVLRSRRMAADADKLTGGEGYRTRVLCKSVVHLIWGKQRLLTKEAGTAAHLDAMRDGNEKKYEDDRRGFVELYDYFLRTNPEAYELLV